MRGVVLHSWWKLRERIFEKREPTAGERVPKSQLRIPLSVLLGIGIGKAAHPLLPSVTAHTEE